MSQRRSRWTQVAAAAFVLTAIHTWPLVTSPARLSLNYHGDVLLNEWIVAWVQHQLPRAPLDLFQANIFHPAPDVLAFSEPLIVPALLAWPIRVLGGSPVLVHNLLLLAGLMLTMAGGYALFHHWTQDHLASILAGAALAFNTQSLARIEHLQAVHAYGLPLALLSADRLSTTGERRHAWWLAAWMVSLAYTSGYLVVITTVALAALVLIRMPAWSGRLLPVIGGLTSATVLTSLVVLPLYLPYRRAAIDHDMTRPLEEVLNFSATTEGYVTSHGRLHGWLWNADRGSGSDPSDAFFPGFMVGFLALGGVVLAFLPAERSRNNLPARLPVRHAVVILLVLMLTGFMLSLGTRTPLYGWLYAIFPPMNALRAAARFGVLFLLGMAGLAGVGLALLRRRAPRSIATAAGFLALFCVTIEAFRAPFPYREFRGIPGVYSLLADEPAPVVLVEVPFYPPDAIFMNAEYVLNSTAHWRPLMNGYSGYVPKTYRDRWDEFWLFPEPASVEAMKAAGATHIMVHPARFGNDAASALRRALANPALERIAVGTEDLTLFRIR
jgi:hypothetical protein